MRKLLILIVFVGIALPSFAQQTYSAVKTSTEGGRWEIVQSPILRKCTIKLDKFTGKTYQLVSTSDGDGVTWQEILWLGDIFDNNIKTDIINYQIFMGGIVAKDCFLMNIHTGRTWILTLDNSIDNVYWATILGK